MLLPLSGRRRKQEEVAVEPCTRLDALVRLHTPLPAAAYEAASKRRIPPPAFGPLAAKPREGH
jgi:hypothetical protein